MGLGANDLSVFADSDRNRRWRGLSLVSGSATGVSGGVCKMLSTPFAASAAFYAWLQVLEAVAHFPLVPASSALLILPVTGLFIR